MEDIVGQTPRLNRIPFLVRLAIILSICFVAAYSYFGYRAVYLEFRKSQLAEKDASRTIVPAFCGNVYRFDHVPEVWRLWDSRDTCWVGLGVYRRVYPALKDMPDEKLVRDAYSDERREVQDIAPIRRLIREIAIALFLPSIVVVLALVLSWLSPRQVSASDLRPGRAAGALFGLWAVASVGAICYKLYVNIHGYREFLALPPKADAPIQVEVSLWSVVKFDLLLVCVASFGALVLGFVLYWLIKVFLLFIWVTVGIFSRREAMTATVDIDDPA